MTPTSSKPLSVAELSSLYEACLLDTENEGEAEILANAVRWGTYYADKKDPVARAARLRAVSAPSQLFDVAALAGEHAKKRSPQDINVDVNDFFDAYPGCCRRPNSNDLESDEESTEEVQVVRVEKSRKGESESSPISVSQAPGNATSQIEFQHPEPSPLYQPPAPSSQAAPVNPYARKGVPQPAAGAAPATNPQVLSNVAHAYSAWDDVVPQQCQQQPPGNPFRTANEWQPEDASSSEAQPQIRDSLKRKFQPPVRRVDDEVNNRLQPRMRGLAGGARPPPPRRQPVEGGGDDNSGEEDELPEELQHLEPKLVAKIESEIMHTGEPVTFGDIAGLQDAKQTVQEVVCWPMKRPDLFTGLRRAPNGLLLYGPPGTGKTLIGKAIAHESGATFFSISSSSLTSKWSGEAEKLVRTLFAVAAYRQPAVVFIDEIDSLLTQRSADEAESSRRIKTEFLVQLDGTGTSGQGRVLIIGATNRPQELDEAARRRFTKRLYIPLPGLDDRKALLRVLLGNNKHELSDADVVSLATDSDGFSGADLKALSTDAAMGPLRELGTRMMDVNPSDVPPIAYKHFRQSLRGMRPSVATSDLVQYVEWDETYGTKRSHEKEDDEASEHMK